MENSKNFEDKKAAIAAVKNEDVQIPYMPVKEYLQEAEDLHQWALHDKDALLGAGLDEAVLNDLPVLTGATRHAEALWAKEVNMQQEARREWNVAGPEGYELRDGLLHSFRYAFRKRPDLINRVRAIDEDTGHPDMIQDLQNLAVLGKANPQLLEAINMDLSLLDKAAETSDSLAETLAIANGERYTMNEAKLTRDKAYTLLKAAVDEVRECGKYVFWRNDDRLVGYASQYNRRN